MASYSSGIQLDVDSISLSPSEIRNAILNDGTEFAGGNIDIPISASKAYAPDNFDISEFSYFEPLPISNPSEDYARGEIEYNPTDITGDGLVFAPNYVYWLHRIQSRGAPADTSFYIIVDGKEIFMNQFTSGGSNRTTYTELVPFFPARFKSSFKIRIEMVGDSTEGGVMRRPIAENRGPNEGNIDNEKIDWPLVAYK